MSIRAAIETKVRHALAPVHLEVINESDRHSVPPGSESHFRIRVVTPVFSGQRLVDRHRAINRLLAAEIASGVHALALETLTPEEWEARGGMVQQSPPCLGGDG